MERGLTTDPAETPRVAFRPDAIIVPMDGSSDARSALPVARYLADSLRAPIHRVSVIVPAQPARIADRSVHEEMLSLVRGAPAQPAMPTLRDDTPPPSPARAADDPLAVIDEDGDVEVVLRGDLPATLLEYVHQRPDALLCLATRARGGLHRRLVGNLTEALLSEARCPVVVVGPELDGLAAGVPPRTILVAASQDLPPATVPLVAFWAIMMDAEVQVAHVTLPSGPTDTSRTGGAGSEPAALVDWLVAAFGEHGIEATGRTLSGGQVTAVLLDLAAQLDGPVLLAAPVGSRQDRTPADVTHQLLQRSRWPVLASVGRDG